MENCLKWDLCVLYIKKHWIPPTRWDTKQDAWRKATLYILFFYFHNFFFLLVLNNKIVIFHVTVGCKVVDEGRNNSWQYLWNSTSDKHIFQVRQQQTTAEKNCLFPSSFSCISFFFTYLWMFVRKTVHFYSKILYNIFLQHSFFIIQFYLKWTWVMALNRTDECWARMLQTSSYTCLSLANVWQINLLHRLWIIMMLISIGKDVHFLIWSIWHRIYGIAFRSIIKN